MRNTEPLWDHVEARKDAFLALADSVFDTPETLYAEFRSAAAHRAALEAQGFRVTEAPAGIPTAVIGEAGEGGPVIAILGEYDALPGLSQKPGAPEPEPLEPGGNGHGCGHNLLGAAALLAATAVKDWLAENGIAARVRYYGCPAEEGGAAKTFMVRDGLFEDVDAALSWHPACVTGVFAGGSLANARIDYAFHGKAAHAAAAPELGRSALDACELMNIGVNYLREHMPDGARVHYAYLDAGGPAPNVVQAQATVRQLIRAHDLAALRDLIGRVDRIAEGAALMTGTRVERRVFSGVSNLLGNAAMDRAMQAQLDRLGPVPFDADDRAFAETIRATLSPEDIATPFRQLGLPPEPDKPLCDFVIPAGTRGAGFGGSTDMGDVSWAAPTAQAWVATWAMGTAFHTWQVVAQGKSGPARKGMAHAAKALAGTAAALIADPALREAARAEHRAALAAAPYACPIPPEATPPLVAPPA